MRLHLIPFFGNRLLTDLTADDVENYRGKRILRNGKVPSLSPLNGDQAVLKHMLYLAMKKNLIRSNPACDVTMPDPRNERDRVLTAEEWARLNMEAAPHLKPILVVAYHLGQRYSEIVNLTWDRVDLKRGMIRLRAIDTKTKQPREVPITPELTQVFRDLYKVRYFGQDRVFLRDGEAITSVRTAFERARRRAGIKDFHFHDFRHCAATNLRRAGVDTTTAMAIVSHKSEKMWRRYNTIEEGDLKQAAARLNTYLTLTHRETDLQGSNTAIS